MTRIRSVLSVALLVFGLWVIAGDGAGVSYAQKPGKNNGGKGPAVKKMQNAVIIKQLRYTHAVLKAANGMYGGHRGKALKQISAAIGELQPGKGGNAPHMGDVPRVISNALLVQTGKQLEVIANELASIKGSPRRAKAAGHVQAAYKQLLLGLQFAARKP